MRVAEIAIRATFIYIGVLDRIESHIQWAG